MSMSTFHAVRLFPNTNIDHVKTWISDNIDDCVENEHYHIVNSTDGDTFVLFMSMNDMYAFEEDYSE